MLCFLPPILPTPPSGQPPSTPRCSGVMGTVMIVLLVGAALLTPIGWVRTQPVYAMRVGIASRLGPRPEERDLASRFANLHGAGGGTGAPHAFFVRQQRYDAIPPGLRVESATGALVGVPSMAGTYTLAVGVSDGTREPIIGAPFKVKVLPAS